MARAILFDPAMIQELSQVMSGPESVLLGPMPINRAADFLDGKQVAAVCRQHLENGFAIFSFPHKQSRLINWPPVVHLYLVRCENRKEGS